VPYQADTLAWLKLYTAEHKNNRFYETDEVLQRNVQLMHICGRTRQRHTAAQVQQLNKYIAWSSLNPWDTAG